jgi:hypothetical protein
LIHRLIVAAVSISAIVGCVVGLWWGGRNTLDPTISIDLVEAGLGFQARLDSGAVVSSINALDIRVIGGGAEPAQSDAGKLVSFVLVNERGERKQLSARIVQVRGIRTADCREVRYHVYLTVKFRGRSHRILTNLNDRSRAEDKLLLGRNWLWHGYAVGPSEKLEL